MNNENNTTNDTIENDDLLHALRISCGNLAICLDEENENLDGRNELFGQYEN
jgi:hypothetical protein